MTDLRPRIIEEDKTRMSQNRPESSGSQGDAADYKEYNLTNNYSVPLKSHLSEENKEDDEDSEHGYPMVRFMGYTINKIVLVTHFDIFLYSCSFWIQNAVFPYLSKQLGADPVVFGYLQTTFAVVQLAGGPLFGRFGDLFGSQLAMVLAFSAAATSYFLLSVSTSIPLLFLSRLPSVFMHAMQGGQMIVTDVCSSKNRADALGKLGISYGIGMVVGPVIGGWIAKLFTLEKAAAVSCLLSILSILITIMYVPSIKKSAPADKDQDIFSVKKIVQLLGAPGALFLICLKLATGIPIGIFQSMFSVVALDTFKLPPEQNSYIMSYIGIMAMIVQGVGVGIVTKKFSELNILFYSACCLIVSYLMLSYVTTIWQMCLVFIPLISGLTFQTVVTTSALTHAVSDSDTGAMLGLSMAVHALIRSLSPTIGGYMLSAFGFHSFGLLGFFTSSVVTVFLFFKKQRETS